MIINSLWAENVLKYSLLHILDIPPRGLIAVIGDNESGKSSIGESICFALFGRTFSLAPADLGKIIRWGESRCSIKLELTTPDGQRYQIARFLDERGNHGASISRSSESPMVRGVAEVEAALKDIVGFGYTELIESFYLAQREITTPHPHSSAVKAMAGVTSMEKVIANCLEEADRAGELAVETASELAEIQSRIEALALQEGHLESLQARQEERESDLLVDRRRIAELEDSAAKDEGMLGRLHEVAPGWLAVEPTAPFAAWQAQQARLEGLLADLAPHCGERVATARTFSALADFAADTRERLNAFEGLSRRAGAYREQLERLLGAPAAGELKPGEQSFAARKEQAAQEAAAASSSRGTNRLLIVLCLLLGIGSWALVGLVGLAPDSQPAQKLSGWLSGLGADWEAQLRPWLILAASAFTLLFLAFMGHGIGLRSRLKQLAHAREALAGEEESAIRDARDLAALHQMPLSEALGLLGLLPDESIAAHAADYAQGLGGALVDVQEAEGRRDAFGQTVAALEGGIAKVKAAALSEADELQHRIAGSEGEIARLEEAIREEQARVRRHLELGAIAGNLESRVQDLRRRVEVRELAADLLKGAIHYISQRFNTEVRNLAAESLPKFTNGRYEHLLIDENLNVKAFSNEKRNFMDLDEISSGTQRQIMLAVRLALSQKLVNSVIQGPQMLYLDEPFAFFDETRTASALAVLPQVSGDFTQIWVTSQTFPPQSRFDLYIHCNAVDSTSPLVKRGK